MRGCMGHEEDFGRGMHMRHRMGPMEMMGGPGPRGGFRFGFGGPEMGGARMRARRGHVKAAILGLLNEEPRHGYDIISEIEKRSNGIWKPSPGSIYPTLQVLEDQGLIVGSDSEGKRVYSITDAGRSDLENLPDGGFSWDNFGDNVFGGASNLRDQMMQLGGAVMQVVAGGNASQMEEVSKLLVETKKKVFRLLAEDD